MEGTFQKYRDNDQVAELLPSLTEIPEPPEILNEDGRKERARIVKAARLNLIRLKAQRAGKAQPVLSRIFLNLPRREIEFRTIDGDLGILETQRPMGWLADDAVVARGMALAPIGYYGKAHEGNGETRPLSRP